MGRLPGGVAVGRPEEINTVNANVDTLEACLSDEQGSPYGQATPTQCALHMAGAHTHIACMLSTCGHLGRISQVGTPGAGQREAGMEMCM